MYPQFPQNYGMYQPTTQMNQPVQQPYYQTTPQVYQPTAASIPGRIVKSIDDITPNEIPMDGSIGVFPQADNSCVYLKQWGSDGTIHTVKYVPVVETTDDSNQNGSKTNLDDRLDKIDKTLDSIQKRLYSKNKPYYNKKRSSTEGNSHD